MITVYTPAVGDIVRIGAGAVSYEIIGYNPESGMVAMTSLNAINRGITRHIPRAEHDRLVLEQRAEEQERRAAPTLHAHVSTAASDCDGPLYRDYVQSLNDDERAEHENAQGVNDFHDLRFKERVLAGHVSFSPLESVKVEIDEHGFRVHEPTDEGYRAVEVRWCEDPDCDPDERHQRDVFAEAAGY